MSTFVFRVSVIDDYGDFECWRDIEVPTSATLYRFAEGIVDAFGFDFDHAFGFYSDLSHDHYDSRDKYELFVDMGEVDLFPGMRGGTPKSVRKTKLSSVFSEPGQQMQFIFDYGDEWRFLVKVTETGKRKKGERYPRLVNAGGEAPEQYPDWDEEEDDDI